MKDTACNMIYFSFYTLYGIYIRVVFNFSGLGICVCVYVISLLDQRVLTTHTVHSLDAFCL